jgi:hypothetical protein
VKEISATSSKILVFSSFRILFNLYSAISNFLSMALQSLVDLGHFISFLIYAQSVGFLGRGSAGLEAATYTQHKHRINAHRHPCLEWDWNYNPSVRAGKDGSFLRPRGHCDRRYHTLCR